VCVNGIHQEDIMPVINTNLAANSALRYTNLNTAAENKLISQLSSGKRVQTAADDAASNSIAAKIKSDSTTLGQAAINASTAQAVINTANAGYAAISDVLQRLKAITTAAQAGTLDSGAFTNLDKEYQALVSEVSSIASQTKFDGVSLLDGSGASGTFSNASGANVLLGTSSTDTINIIFSNATSTALSLATATITSAAVAASASSLIDTAITSVAGFEAAAGASLSRVNFRSSVINVSKENADASVSALTDADVAATETAYTNADVLTQAGIAALQKANALPQQLLTLLKS
jgi:flagellin